MAETKTLSLRIPAELVDKIDALVGEGQSRNAILKEIITLGLEAMTGDEKKAEEERIEQLAQAIASKVTPEVAEKVQKNNDELYRDMTTTLAATVLPTAIREATQGFDETLHKIEEATVITVEESEINPKALPEGEGSTASEPAETEEDKEIDLDDYSWLDQWAIRRVRGLNLSVQKR